MRDIFKKLLDAEESGRSAAREKEAEADAIINRAKEDASHIAEDFRSRARTEIERLEARSREHVAKDKKEIAQQMAADLESLKDQVQRNRAVAIEQVVQLLLGEG